MSLSKERGPELFLVKQKTNLRGFYFGCGRQFCAIICMIFCLFCFCLCLNEFVFRLIVGQGEFALTYISFE